MLINLNHSRLPRVLTMTALPLLFALGCSGRVSMEPPNHGEGGFTNGVAGTGGTNGGAATGGSSAVAGSAPSEGGWVEAGGSWGNGGFAEQGGAAGDGGAGGEPAICEPGYTLCVGHDECTNLQVGTTLGADVFNCGTCGTTCRLDHAKSATCFQGQCAPACQAGFADCNFTTTNDGCETDITTPDHCGTCQYACSNSGTTSRSCTSGICSPTCMPRYANCNAVGHVPYDDGCETYLDRLDQCGTACGVSVACNPNKVCNDGSCVAPSGLTVLSVPATDMTGAQTRFSYIIPKNPVNLEGATVTLRVYAPGATGGTLALFASDNSSAFGPQVTTKLVALSQKWTDISVTIVSPAINATQTRQINLLVTTGPGATDPTMVYIDGLRATSPGVNDTFDTSIGGWVKSGLIAVSGSTVGWVQAIP
jgi:hypothetical protein